ncbi:MAG: YraN family protein [Candidatus Levybacteria bacterium]|nr:YraN family protein [Candidatus Levybacteria bacterium]
MKISNPTAKLGEELAVQFLRKRGYKIIDRNFRKGYGEIDIIALQGRTLVFVEVKTRTSYQFGAPFEQITPFKLHSLVKTAQFYKVLNPKLPQSLRIDAISVLLDYSGDASNIEHVENISGF